MSIWSYVRPYRRRLVVGVLLLLATNAFDKAIPWLLQGAVDALAEGRLEELKSTALLVIGLAAGLWIVRTQSRIQIFNVGRDVEYDLRNEVIEAVHRLGPSFLTRMPTGEVMSRATNDLGQVRLLVGFGGLNGVNTVFAYVGAIVLMTLISPTLTLLALLPFPALILMARIFGKMIFTRSREAQAALGRLSEVAQETITGVRVVRAFGIEDVESRRFEEANQNAVDKNMRLVVLRGTMWPLLMLVGSIAELIVLWQGGLMLGEGLTPGELTAFLAYLAQLKWPTLAFGWLLSVVQRGRASYGRVREILDAQPDIQQPTQPIELPAKGGLQVDALSFSYGDNQVVHDVSFDVEPQQSIALMGGVGAGKSTLATLLPRLAQTPPGSVFVDGVDVTDADLHELRRSVAYAPQEPFLFSTTIERNIAFGLADPDAPDAEARIRKAAQDACVLEEIEQLPEGFETLVGERGVQLSGGQKQRVALARALLNEPAVLVLDDPLSAVDAKTESLILSALDRAGEGRTMVLITHRVAAAARCDRVVVLEEGKVVERGTHEELCRSEGLYSRIARRQRLEEELASL